MSLRLSSSYGTHVFWLGLKCQCKVVQNWQIHKVGWQLSWFRNSQRLFLQNAHGINHLMIYINLSQLHMYVDIIYVYCIHRNIDLYQQLSFDRVLLYFPTSFSCKVFKWRMDRLALEMCNEMLGWSPVKVATFGSSSHYLQRVWHPRWCRLLGHEAVWHFLSKRVILQPNVRLPCPGLSYMHLRFIYYPQKSFKMRERHQPFFLKWRFYKGTLPTWHSNIV